MTENNQDPLADFLTEEELGSFLGLNKNSIGYLRNEKGLPFCRVSNTRRVYYVHDIREWLLSHRVVSQSATVDDNPHSVAYDNDPSLSQ